MKFATGLTEGAARSQAKALAKMRGKMLREQERADVDELRAKIDKAKRRRRAALVSAAKLCARARERVKGQVRELRARERERLRLEVQQMKAAARNRCQLRKHLIQVSGRSAVAQQQARLREERRLAAQLERLGRAASLKAKTRTTAKERRQEDDDAVRSNLPRELLPVFERVKRQIKGSARRTRTEAFLEWAEENPGDVLAYQEHDTDREVRRLVAEYETKAKRLRKTKSYEPPAAEVATLTKMGLDSSATAARRRATAGLRDWVPF